MLQAFANHLIGVEQIGRGDALAIGRIGHHQGRLGRLLEVLEVLQLNGDGLRQSCCTYVQTGLGHSLRVDVVAIDVVVAIAFLRVVVVYLVEELLVEVGPFLEGKLLAEQAGTHVAGDEGCLDEQRTASTHGVDEVGLAAPARHQDHACCQHLVERGLGRLLTIAATMQALARRVETHRGVEVGNVDMEADVGIRHRHIRPVARLLAELVDDGVLHLVGHKARVAELLAIYNGVDRERLALLDVLAPVNFLHLVVHVLGRARLETGYRLQDTDCRVQLEVGTIHHFLVTLERHHTTANLHVVRTQIGQFFCQDGLQTHECLGNHFILFLHTIN